MMPRRLAVLSVAVIVIAAGCSSSKSTKAEGNAKAAAPTYEVQVDGKTSSFNGAFLAYFPNEVKVHPGSTVTFKSVYRGEPHTVTLGTLVDAGVPKALAGGGNEQEEPPELAKIPNLLPRGPGDANQVTGQPCFLASGDPPTGDGPCPKEQRTQPEFNGTQTYYNSGFLPDKATFSVKLSANIKPGTYTYFCALHRADMSGKITVVEKGKAVPTPDQATQAGKKQLNVLAQKLQTAAKTLKGGTLPPFVTKAAPGQVVAGGGSLDATNAAIEEFGPVTASIPVGGSATWTVFGVHTISFNAPDSANNFLAKKPDGSIHLNQQAGDPAGGPGQPQDQGPPPSSDSNGPPPPPTVIDGGSWDGNGFRSSGIFTSFPPQLSAYKLTFTKAGTYKYVCLIHPGMKGTIKVS